MSKDDRENIRKNYYPSEIEMIVALSEKRRTQRETYTNNECVLKGTHGNYKIEVGTYYKADENDDGTIAEIWVPITEVANIASEPEPSPPPGYLFDYISPCFMQAVKENLSA